ncbi:glycosyltransferase [Stenotrophomonas maltophilia]|uniref:glycosyltransferase n=1 Tax=Stenotrophomonas maltophilia TaxID=40324 RepID=UPI002ACC433F|nr:glycosyltransferase [Stenotrophomonas maltophilia]MDZ5841073.1 glycosyltransferase [Stenotrophomonas maltophilia]
MRALVISNMFPSPESPASGVFVRRISEQMMDHGISVQHVVKGNGSSKIASYFKFYFLSFWASLISRHDLIYLHFPSHAFPAVWLALALRNVPLIVHVHGADVAPDRPGRLRQALVRFMTARALRRASLVIAPSPYFQSLVSSEFPWCAEKIRVSPSGGVDTQFLKYVPVRYRARRRVLFLGRLIRGKGAHLLMDAAGLLNKTHPELAYELVFAGDGPERSSLEDQASSLSGTQIAFLGQVPPEKVPSVIADCDVLVFPSYRRGESLGLVALEAMACGKPVVAALNGAMDGIIDHGLNGYLFSPNRPDELAEALRSLICMDHDRLTIMSQLARTRAEQYSSGAVGAQLSDLLHRHIIEKVSGGHVS